jgi:hypothetical protein
MESRALAAVIVAVVQGRRDIRQQRGELRLALDQRPHADIVTVEVQKIEDKEHQPGGSLHGNREISGSACGWTLQARIGKARSRSR